MSELCTSLTQTENMHNGNKPFFLSGFEVYEAPPATLVYETVGSDSQILELQVPSGQKVMAEPGTMCHMHEGFDREIDSSSGCKRCCLAGESFFRLHYINNTTGPLPLGLTPNFPAKIIVIDMIKYSGLTVKSGAFMAALSPDIEVRLRLTSFAKGCCGGQGFILNSLHGSGTAFLNASGTILHKILKDGEALIVDTNSVVAFEQTVGYDIRRNGGCLMCCCGGEGLFNTVLRGPGMVILQSMPFEKMAAALQAAVPTQQQ